MSPPNPVTTLLKSFLQQQFYLPSTSCPADEKMNRHTKEQIIIIIIIWKDRVSIWTRHGRRRLNKNVQPKSWEKCCIWGITEDYSLGDTLSDDSEELFQRGSGGDRIIRVFLKTKENKMHGQISKDHFSSHKKPDTKLMIVVLLYIWEDVIVWAHWNLSFDMHVSYLGPVSSFFHSEFPSGHTIRGCNADGMVMGNIHCLLRWQARFLCPQRDLGMIRPGI